MLSKEEKQQLVEFSVMAMVSQGGPGFDSEREVCRYQDDDGNRCGIGFLLTEEECEHYDTLGESAISIAIDKVNGWTADDGEFLESLQNCHDHAARNEAYGELDFMEGFRWRVEEFCNAHGLRFPEEYI